VLIWQRTLWPDSTGNSEWRLDVLDNFGKPVFRVRLLAESLEEAAGFKTVSAMTPASG